MTQPVVSRNGKITVPFDKVTKAWVAGYIDHPGHSREGWCIDTDGLNEQHKARLTRDRANAQRWADRAERRLGGLL